MNASPDAQLQEPAFADLLAAQIAELEQQVAEEAEGAYVGGRRGGAKIPPNATPEDIEHQIQSEQWEEAIDQRISRLQDLRDWIEEDPDLGRLIDSMIGARIHAAEEREQKLAHIAQRRQRVLSIVGACVTLIAGWLLSLVGNPATVGRLLP